MEARAAFTNHAAYQGNRRNALCGRASFSVGPSLGFDPIISAGADSASSVISSFFPAVTLHPEIFSELQAEIDTVVGRDRLPELSDREKLPFLECVIKEVYRWNPPAPIAAADAGRLL